MAMFTEEQRAAAVAAVYEPPEILRPIPPPAGPAAPSLAASALIQVGGRLLDPNKPGEQAEIFAAGWRFEAGRWIAPGSLGQVATPDQAARVGASRPSSISSVPSASSVQGGSVLGTTVPVAPPVLLPSFVGGRIGVVRIGGGMRPESGGHPDRVRFGDPSTMPVVRMEQAGGGGGGGSW